MDTKTDAKVEAVSGSHMADMCPMDPRALLDAIARHECNEAALYAMLAQCAPTPCLQSMIAQMAAEEAGQAAALAAIAAAYGLGAIVPVMPGQPAPFNDPPYMPPHFHTAGESEKEEK